MIDITELMIIILCILGCVFVVAATVLVLRLIKTVKKVDYLIDDVTMKSSKLDGVFDIVDRSADALTLLTDKAVLFVSNILSNVFKKKEKGEEEENE